MHINYINIFWPLRLYADAILKLTLSVYTSARWLVHMSIRASFDFSLKKVIYPPNISSITHFVRLSMHDFLVLRYRYLYMLSSLLNQTLSFFPSVET